MPPRVNAVERAVERLAKEMRDNLAQEMREMRISLDARLKVVEGYY